MKNIFSGHTRSADTPVPTRRSKTNTPRWVKVTGGNPHPPGPVVCDPAPHRQWLWRAYAHGTLGATAMIMPPGLRKAALTAHVASSIGWFGAVAVFLALAIAGMTSQNPELVRAAYLVMGVTTWGVIVPLAFVSLLTGVVSSLFTRWGLFRYYWVLLKLVITVLATLVLLVHTQFIDFLAGAAAKTAVLGADLRGAQREIVIASGAALGVLLALTVLSVYKPRGMTPYGQRKLDEQRQEVAAGEAAD